MLPCRQAQVSGEGGLLRCVDIFKSFDGVHALAGISVGFPGSGTVAVIGPNGAGKTTLLNVLTGFVRADRGHVFMGASDIGRLQPYQVARLGIARTFQDLRLIERETVLNNVMLARPNQRGEKLLYALFRFGVAKDEAIGREAAMERLCFVGLADKASQLAGGLSYGEQKLLTLACCLTMRAKILLLDEPVAGVHPELANKILSMLAQLGAEGKLVIFVEHDISAVRQIADRVVVMDAGLTIADGAPSDILERPEILEAYVG